MKSIIALFFVFCSFALADDWKATEEREIKILADGIAASKSVTLYAVDGNSGYAKKKEGEEVITMPGIEGSWRVIRSRRISDVGLRQSLARSLENGVRESERMAFSCFMPRHAVRFTLGEKEVTLLICFSCAQVYVDGYPGCPGFHVTQSPRDTWNQVFREVGLISDEKKG